ncbi:hypothetical protein IWX78_002778 [Mycetocola sp. CAN_C7]|uniref:hypothetical protein n=1 Tax=Mycetocola sp. CAN_C7 TaxID=2787724 RepID=UPI0018CB86FE
MTFAAYSALTRPVSAAEVTQFRQWAKTSGWIKTTRAPVSSMQLVVLVVFGVIAFSVFGSSFSTIASLLGNGVGAGGVFSFVVPIVLGASAAVVAVSAWRGWSGTAATWEKRLRLREFAAARNATYTGHIAAPAYAGMIFDIGTSRSSIDSVRADGNRPLEIANYRYTVKRGKSSTVYRWGYIALRLDRRLPHMVLDATSNNLFGSNLPQRFGADSALSLEGDFDNYFTLYAPPEYGRDALYVFTPDLMALLIDESSAFDVEIVDDWMFVYSTKPFDLVQPAVWQRLDRIVETVGAKTLSQTDRYADDRVGDPRLNVVAPQGRRMKSSLGPVAVLVIVVAIGWFGLNIWQAVS